MFKEILFVSKASDQAVKLYNVTYLRFTNSDLVLSGIRRPNEYRKLDRSSVDSECAFYNLLDKSSFSNEAINIITNREARNNIDVYLDKQSTIFGLGERHVLNYTMVDLQKDLAEQEAYEKVSRPVSVKIDARIKTPEFVKINTEIKRKWDEVVPSYVKRSDDVITMLNEIDPVDINKMFGGITSRKPYSINIPLTESTNNLYANAMDLKPLDMTFGTYDTKPLYSFFKSIVERSEKEKEHREILNSALKEMHDNKDKNMRNEINISFKDNMFYTGVQYNNPTIKLACDREIEELKYCNMYSVTKEAVDLKSYLDSLASNANIPIQSFKSSGITINYFVEEAKARELISMLNISKNCFRLENKLVYVLVDKNKISYDINVGDKSSFIGLLENQLDLLYIYTDQLTQKHKDIYQDVNLLTKNLHKLIYASAFKEKLVTFVPVLTESYVKSDGCELSYPTLHRLLSKIDIDKCTDTLEKLVKGNGGEKVHTSSQDFKVKFDTELDKETCDEIAAACGLVKKDIPESIHHLWDRYTNVKNNQLVAPVFRILDTDTSLTIKAKCVEDLYTALSKVNNGIELWMYEFGDFEGFNTACLDFLNTEGYAGLNGDIFLVSLAFSEKYLKNVNGNLCLVFHRPNTVHMEKSLLKPSHSPESGYKHPFIDSENNHTTSHNIGYINPTPISDKVKVAVGEDNKMMYIHYDNNDKLSEVRFGQDEQVDYDKYVYHVDNTISHIENYRNGEKIGTAYLRKESDETTGETPYEKIVADDLINGNYFWTLTNKRFEYNDKGMVDFDKINKSLHNKSFWILFKDKYESVYETVIKEMGSRFTCNEKPEYILISYKAAQNAKYGLEKILPELSILSGNDIIKYCEELIPENETN